MYYNTGLTSDINYGTKITVGMHMHVALHEIGHNFGTVRVFRQKVTLENAIGPHACSLEALLARVWLRVTDAISPESPLLLPVGTVPCVQTLKALTTTAPSALSTVQHT
jgi:hypothetical protein